MGKNIFSRAIRLLLLLGCLLCLFTGCSLNGNSPTKAEDYVEVTGLRIDKADVYMSPLGEFSTYQLNVQILPANATNRKLTYFIPSEYLTYVSVDSNGLLTAHENTGDKVVPLTVTSTTNENAKLTVNIVVEEVAVKKILFSEESMSFWYEGEAKEVSINYFPSHATDGRSVTYESLDDSVAVVTQDKTTGNAIITPIGAGQTHIKAVAITTDRVRMEAFMPVTVNYMPAQYQLHVSGSPQWTQVVNNFSEINFTLYVLGDHIDPNPEIEWYVGTERVLGQSDMRQYSHMPTATTQITYQVRVFVRAYKQEGIWLTSDDIVIYNDFVGFDLVYQNLSSAYTPYQYGDQARFELLEASTGNTASYDWFLQKMDGDGQELFLANTLVDARDLIGRVNVVGDFQLMAKAKSGDGTYLKQTMFTFSSDRLVKGDVLVVDPSLLEGGLPPDSYHWYLLECNEDGQYDLNAKKEISSTAKEETFYYPLTKTGYFRFLVTSSTNGVLTTVAKEGGGREEYKHISKLIRVYEDDDVLEPRTGDLVDLTDPAAHAYAVSNTTRVNDLVVEGCGYMGENLLYAHWTPCAGVDRYIAEITFEDGTVRILDSADKEAVFGTNYLYIPSGIASFDDKFGLRVKQKDGLFSEYCYYNILNDQGTTDKNHIARITEDKFPYFANITNNVNGYVTTMDELYSLVEYILLYLPTQNNLVRKGNTTINGVLYDTFTVNFYTTLKYTTDMMNAFSVVPPDDLPNEYIDIYTMICGVQQQGPYLADFTLNVKGNADGSYAATFTVPNSRSTRFTATPSRDKNEDVSSASWSNDPYTVVDIIYPVERKEGVYVSTSDQLCHVLEQGYRPIPTGNDDLAELYKQIKSVYSSIVGQTTSDLNKALAFYDWLCYKVAYDTTVEEISFNQTELENYRYESHHLEGIFALKNINNRHAVPAGYAKAFSALCGLAGIPCRTVAAKVGTYRVYNKVYVNDAWYVVDVGYGVVKKDDIVYPDHTCFLMSDGEYSAYCLALGYRADTYGIHPTAEKKFDFYTDFSLQNHSLYVSSAEEVETLVNTVTRSGVVALEMECSSSFCSSIATFRSIVSQISPLTGKYVGGVVDISEEGGNVRAIVLLYDNE